MSCIYSENSINNKSVRKCDLNAGDIRYLDFLLAMTIMDATKAPPEIENVVVIRLPSVMCGGVTFSLYVQYNVVTKLRRATIIYPQQKNPNDFQFIRCLDVVMEYTKAKAPYTQPELIVRLAEINDILSKISQLERERLALHKIINA